MVYIVLGMHKSGTTMLSETLHKSGINMGDFNESISYYSGQKYEREDVSHVLWDVLDCREKHSLDTFPPFDANVIERELPALISLIGRYNQQYAHWGFKEPRTLFIYEKIKTHLGRHKVICVHRNVKDVVLHYLQFAGFDLKSSLKAIKAWKLYNKEMLRIIRNHENNADLMLINYKEFVIDPASVDKLSSFVGQKLVDVRKPYHKKKRGFKRRLHLLVARIILLLNIYGWKSVNRQISEMKDQKVASV